MNGKICKRLRKVAAGLPVIPTTKLVSVPKSGHEILADQEDQDKIQDKSGKQIDPDKIYNQFQTVDWQMDHYKNLKFLYTTYGLHTLPDYTRYVKQKKAQLDHQAAQKAARPLEEAVV